MTEDRSCCCPGELSKLRSQNRNYSVSLINACWTTTLITCSIANVSVILHEAFECTFWFQLAYALHCDSCCCLNIIDMSCFNLQATKLFIVTSATKADGDYHPAFDLVYGSKYCIVWYSHWFSIVCWV